MTRTRRTTTPRRTRGPRALATTLVTALVGGLAALGVAAPATAADDDALSGVYGRGGRVADVRAFEDWRGRDVGIVTDFVDGSTWSTIAHGWVARYWADKGYEVAYSVPMLPATGGSLQTGATGAYDRYFVDLAEVLVSTGQGDAIIRTGWEMNGRWFSWTAIHDPEAFVGYWRSIVRAMNSVDGADFRFEWSPQLGEGTPGFDKLSAYPGDAYVDLIGASLYDQSWALEPSQQAARWSDLVEMDYGLRWSVEFAKARGKQSSLAEWALSSRCDGNGGEDDAYFVRQLASWVAAHDYAYESYFNANVNACQVHSLTTGPFPKARAAYRDVFGAGALEPEVPAAAPAPVTGPTTSIGSSVLQVSWMSTRTDLRPVAWMGLSTRVFVVATPSFTVNRVRWYLDDADASGTPLHTDTSAPWDLVGGTASNAQAFDARTLAPGKHTITAVFETPTGHRVATATFLR